MATVRAAVLIPLALLAACGGRDTQPAAEAPTFDERVAVFLLADSVMLDSLRAGYSEDDAAVIGDDMMWYRAEAGDWLEQNGVRTVYLSGRPTLGFVVDGKPASFDFSAEPTLDVVVLYEPGSPPVAVAPVDVSARAPEYFGLP